MTIDKQQVLTALRGHVERELSRCTGAHKDVQAGATHEEARAENDKDTRALEATYLARGLAERAVQLEAARQVLSRLVLRDFGDDEPIGVSALVQLEDTDTGDTRSYFVTPVAGGVRLDVEAGPVMTVTPEAPVGRALVGSRLGECLQVRTPQGTRELEVTDLW